MRLGYSCWGFLGKGVLDTPDGGRSHRKVLIDEFTRRGASILMLQNNRDLLEAGEHISQPRLSFDSGLPSIEALFLEYRWRIPGRNVEVSPSDPSYTPDYDRQSELLAHYIGQSVHPIMIWDKDRQITPKEAAAFVRQGHVIFEPSFTTSAYARQLLFPIRPDYISSSVAWIGNHYRCSERRVPLIYIGNQYDRDESFNEYVNRASQHLNTPAEVYGNWLKYPHKACENQVQFRHVQFRNRAHFADIHRLYKSAFCTVLIAPERYYRSGQVTQRLFECLAGGCIPLIPRAYSLPPELIVPEFNVTSGVEVAERIGRLSRMDDRQLQALMIEQVERLAVFEVSAQIDRIYQVLA